MFNGISESAKELINECKADGIKVDTELIQGWIETILDDLTKDDILTVALHLLKVERTVENLLEVYSFVDARWDEIQEEE